MTMKTPAIKSAALRILVLAWLALFCSIHAKATTISGNLTNGSSVGISGTLYLRLSQEAAQLSTGGCGGPAVVVPTVQVVITITNGVVPGTTIVGNDCLAPPGTYYIVTFQDNQSNILFTENWQITGATENVGSILPIIIPQGTVSIGSAFISNLVISGLCTYNGVNCATAGSGTVTHTPGALTAGLPVIGNGLADITVGTKTGNTTQFPTWSGPATTARCVDTDANGNLQVTANDCGTGSGANTALSNLASVSINTSLLAQAGVDLGSTANSFRNLYLSGSGSWSETTAPSSLSNWDICYGDSAVHALKCNFNNAGFGQVPLLSTDNTWATNQRFKGPVPFADVTAFGAHGDNAGTKTTATMLASSTAVTLAVASNFANSDYVTIVGAGPNTGLSTPGAPTVTPSIAAAGTALGGGTAVVGVVNSVTGSTTYKYRIIARTKYRGHTTVGSVGTTVVGQASLGSHDCDIATESLANDVITITTSTPCYVSAGALVHLNGGTSGDFTGWPSLNTVNTGTYESFTTQLNSLDSRGLGWQGTDTTSSTGGKMAFKYSNHLIWTPVPNAWEYYVCTERGVESNYYLIGQTGPSSSVIGWVEAQFDDYGSPYMDSQVYPLDIETASDTPNSNDAICSSGVAVPDALTTKIVSGGGTPSLIVADASSNPVSGSPIFYDDAPAILAAANTVTTGHGTLFLPGLPNFNAYEINSYLALPANISVQQIGQILTHETIELTGSTNWNGLWANTGLQQFGWIGSAKILGEANPTLYVSSSGVFLNGIFITNSYYNGVSAGNGGTGIVVDAGNPFTMNNVAIVGSASAATDYLSMNLVLRSNASGGNQTVVTNALFSGGPDQVINKSLTPLIYIPPAQNGSGGLLNNQYQEFTCNFCNFNRRGIEQEQAAGNGGQWTFDWVHRQGGITPFLMFGNKTGITAPFVVLKNVLLDTESVSVVAGIGAGGGAEPFIYATAVIDGSVDSGNGQVPPPYTGYRPYNVSQMQSVTGKLPNVTGCSENPTGNASIGLFTCFEPILLVGPNAYIKQLETAAPTGAASISDLWNDSTDHRWKMKNNNGTATDVAGLADFAAPPVIGTTPNAGHFTTLSVTSQMTSTLAIGTAPFVITSTTPVANLNIGGRDQNGIVNFNQANQSQVVVSGTEYYITHSDLDMPTAYTTAIGAGTTMRWHIQMQKTAAGTGSFQILLKKGTNGTTGDTSIVTQTIGTTQDATADNLTLDITLTWTSATAAYWSISPRQLAATGNHGFGLTYPAVALDFNGTISGQTTTTASDKYGISFISTTGTPTITVTQVQAQAFGVI